jgi:beta-lactamase regulating signal transducer with metallopeptidase domain
MIASFVQELEQVFGWLLSASWQASVLALFVLMAQRVLGSRLNPRWRNALWLLVLVRLILPVLPESTLSLFQFAPTPPVAVTVSVTEPLFISTPALPPPPSTSPVEPEPTHPFSAYSLLAVAWLVGAVTLLVLTWLVNRRFARQVANSPAVSDPELLELFAEAKAELRIHRPIRLIENEQVQSPAIMGLFQPTLLLPADVREKFDARELRFIFLHELAHLKRGDVMVQALIALLQILHWFNPVLWFAFRRMRIDREPATDALVLSRTGEDEKERYGLMLIKLLEHFNQRHSLPTLVGILEDKDQFKRRFSLIARFTRGAYGWSLLGVLIIGILSVACLTKSKASENSTPTADYLIMNLGQFVDGVDSMDYSITEGDPKGDHGFQRWQEMGKLQRIEMFLSSSWPNGKPFLQHQIYSYDGDYGYMYAPAGPDRLFRHKAPFQEGTEGIYRGLIGPLFPFVFLDKKTVLPSSGWVSLQTLKSPDALAADAARATLEPDKDRSWEGHPCVAVKISGGNDPWDNQARVDFIAYFAKDLDFYPVAYETYKHGHITLRYWVTKFATLPASADGSKVFRYPELASGFAYDSDSRHSSSGGGYSFQLTAPTYLKINTLSKADFTLKPPAGGYIEDWDMGKVFKVQAEQSDSSALPAKGNAETTTAPAPVAQPSNAVKYLELDFVEEPGALNNVRGSGPRSAQDVAQLLNGPKNKVTVMSDVALKDGPISLKGQTPAGFSVTISGDWKASINTPQKIDYRIDNQAALTPAGTMMSSSWETKDFLSEDAPLVIFQGWKPESHANVIIRIVDHPPSAGSATDSGAQSPVANANPAAASTTDTLAQLVLALHDSAKSIPADHHRLQILKGFFGADGSWRDVTGILQKSVQNDSLKVSWQQPYTEIGGDPAWLQVKTLIVSYRLDGAEKLATFRENDPLVGLQATLPEKAAPKASAEVQTPSNVVPTVNLVGSVPQQANAGVSKTKPAGPVVVFESDGNMDKNGDETIFNDNASCTSGNVSLKADRLTYNRKTNVIQGTGHATLAGPSGTFVGFQITIPYSTFFDWQISHIVVTPTSASTSNAPADPAPRTGTALPNPQDASPQDTAASSASAQLQAQTYLEVNYVETTDSSAMPGSTTIPTKWAESMINDTKNKHTKINDFPLQPGINTLQGKTPWGSDFTVTLNWSNSLSNKAQDLGLKMEWVHANGGDFSYGSEFKASLRPDECFKVTGPWKTKETSNLLISFVNHPSEQPQKTGADNASDEAAFDQALEKDRTLVADARITSSTLAADAQMLLAIQKGDVAALKSVLEHAVDPNTFDPERFHSSPVYWAVHFNQPEILKLLLDHVARGYDGPGGETPLQLAQRAHPDLVPILQEGIKRNRALLTTQLTTQLHSMHIDLPAFSNAPFHKVVDFLINAMSKVGYLERRLGVANLDLPSSTTISSPPATNITLWDALQTIADANKLKFDVDEGHITFYPPKDEAVIHPVTVKEDAPSQAPTKGNADTQPTGANTQAPDSTSHTGDSTAQAKEPDPDEWTIRNLRVSDMPLTELAQKLTAMTKADDPNGVGVAIDVKVPPGEAPLKITYGYPPYTGDLGNLLYHLADLYPLRYELQLASRNPDLQRAPITLTQLPVAEAQLNKKAGETKINLDFNGTDFITALNAVQSQAATKGFHFEINVDALKGLSLPPVTLKARNWSVQHALLSLCYLADLVAQPLERFTGYGFRSGSVTELHDRTSIRFGIATAFYKTDNTKANSTVLTNLSRPSGEMKTWGPSVVIPAYSWVYRGNEISPSGGTIGTQFSYHHKAGDPVGFVVPVEGAPSLELNFKTFVADKTHIRATITLRLMKSDGTVLRQLTGETTSPSGAILNLVFHGVPLQLDTHDDPKTKSNFYVFAQADYVDNGKRETDIEPQQLELVSPANIIQQVEMSDTGI